MSRDEDNCWPQSQRWGLAGGPPQAKAVKNLSWGWWVLQRAVLTGRGRKIQRFPWSTGPSYLLENQPIGYQVLRKSKAFLGVPQQRCCPQVSIFLMFQLWRFNDCVPNPSEHS